MGLGYLGPDICGHGQQSRSEHLEFSLFQLYKGYPGSGVPHETKGL